MTIKRSRTAMYKCGECGEIVTGDNSKLCILCAVRLCEACEDIHYAIYHNGEPVEEPDEEPL